MTTGQDKFYWRLWSQLRKARGLGAEERAAQHAALGLPESHTAWNNGHLDKWKGHCLAAAQPANLGAQMDVQSQPQQRRRWRIARLCAQLGQGPEYGEATSRRMNREGALGHGDLASLDDAGLEAVIVALRKHLARQRRAAQAAVPAGTAQPEEGDPF